MMQETSHLPSNRLNQVTKQLCSLCLLAVIFAGGCRSNPFSANPFASGQPTVEDMLAADIPTQFESPEQAPTEEIPPTSVTPPISYASYDKTNALGYSLPKPSRDALMQNQAGQPRNSERQQELIGNYGLEEIWPDEPQTPNAPAVNSMSMPIPELQPPPIPSPGASAEKAPVQDGVTANRYSPSALGNNTGMNPIGSNASPGAYPQLNTQTLPTMPAGSRTQASTPSLSIAVRGASGRGALKVAVFGPASTFPDPRTALQRLDYPAGTKELKISLPTQGNFALAVYEDINGDGMLNRSRFGVPTEPYGFSNNARSTRGAPSFQAAQLAWPATQQVVIALQ